MPGRNRAASRSKLEELPGQSCQLILGRMVDDIVGGEALGSLRPMLLGVVSEVGQGRLSAGHQDRIDALETVADLRKELMLRTNFGAVLSRRMHTCPHVTRLHGGRIDLQNVGVVMVDPHDGVGCRSDGRVHELVSNAFVNSANADIALA